MQLGSRIRQKTGWVNRLQQEMGRADGPRRCDMKNDKVTIKIPRPLYVKIQEVIGESGFNSPTDFVVYVLRDVLSESGKDEADEFSPDELRVLKQKLKNLGYLD